MSSHWKVTVQSGPRGAQVGLAFLVEPGTYRVLGRVLSSAESTLQMTKDGDRALDPERETLVYRAVGSGAGPRTRGGMRRAADVELQDDGVSRTHAMAFVDAAGALSVVDLMSTNGTQVNGTDVQDADLVEGDTLRVGTTCLRVDRA